MTESRDYLEISFRSIECFANDGKLDVYELDKLLDIALKDNVFDENEQRVLSNIISKLTNEELSFGMKRKIKEIEGLIKKESNQ